MAKFKLRTELIPILKNKGIVQPDDTMTLRIPYKDNPISGERCYELTFNVTEAVETTNRVAMMAIEGKRSPAIRVGAGWLIDDPANPWFTKLAEGDATTSKIPDTHGTEVLTKWERKLLKQYRKDSGADIPQTLVKADVSAHLSNAKTYYNG